MLPKMTERLDVLEARMLTLENSLTQTMDEFRRALMAKFAKLCDCRGNEHQSPLLSEESMSEYKMAAKKVELPPFDGKDPVGWITHRDIF